MRISIPLAILLSVAWLVLMSVLISRGGDGARLSAAPADDAAGLLRQSQAAMLELDSLQLEMTTQWEGREDTYRVVWQSPDSFHVLAPSVVAHYYESVQEPEITDYGFVEAIAIADRLYTRQCAEENEDCQLWGEGLRDGTYVPAFAGQFLDPFWTIEILGLMSDAQVVGQEEVDGVSSTRIQGRANITRAMIQSWRRAEEIRGPLYWGQECTGRPAEAGAETQEECHSFTLEEYTATYEETLRDQDENPLLVEVWIGREDKLLRRLEFRTAVAEEPGGSFTFSRFDEVTVEPPK